MFGKERKSDSEELTPEQQEVRVLLELVDFDEVFAGVPEVPTSERRSLLRYFVGTEQVLPEQTLRQPHPPTSKNLVLHDSGQQDTFRVSRLIGRPLGLVRKGNEETVVRLSVKGVDNPTRVEIAIDTDCLGIKGDTANANKDVDSLNQSEALATSERIFERLGLLESATSV